MLEQSKDAVFIATYERFFYADNGLVIELPCLCTAPTTAVYGSRSDFQSLQALAACLK